MDSVDYEMLKKFKDAGCWMISYGIESGDQEVLDSIKKGTTVEQAERAVNLTKKAGLSVIAHCIFGGPKETKKTIQKTIKFVKRIGVDFAQFYCTVPFPGSKLYEQAKEHNWINTNNWENFEQNYSILNTKNITAKKIMFFRRRAYLHFYFHPKRIYNILKKLKSKRAFLNFIRMVKDFLRWI